MRKQIFWHLSSLIFTSLLLSSCVVTMPDSVKGSSARPQQDIAQVLSSPELFIGQESRFGGKVIKIDNMNGKTRLEIATMQLDGSARPILGRASVGRIFADVNGFIDPVDFNNQMVTVVGLIKGIEKGRIGKAQYNFLVISVTGYQRWHMNQQIIIPPPMYPWVWYSSTLGRHKSDYWRLMPWVYHNTNPAQVQTIILTE